MEPPLLQQYRRDRRKLLEFLISSSPSAGLSSVSLSPSDLDSLSADYVIRCLQSGGTIDIAKAAELYRHESLYPIAMDVQSRNSFFLLSDPERAGSPPRRVPPKPDVTSSTIDVSSASSLGNPQTVGARDKETAVGPLKPVDTVPPSLGLPSLITGLSDDDLQESAYEVLLAAMVSSGFELIVPERKKDKSSRILSSIKSRKSKVTSQTQPLGRHFELMNVIRTQMQISEAMDTFIRHRLTQLVGRVGGPIDIPQISLGLLNGIHELEVSNDRQYMHWKSRQVNVLEEVVSSSKHLSESERLFVRSSLAKIKNAKELEKKTSSSSRVEVLSALRQIVVNLSSRPARFGLRSESYYWTTGYHLNIRLYEKLLLGVFDILDESQLIEEADEVLVLIQFTWPTLGITRKLHDLLYGWVLFQRFLETQEVLLLEYAITKFQEVLQAEQSDSKEEKYLDSLACCWKGNNVQRELNVEQSILHSISIWCDSKLQDYHLNFSKEPSTFGTVMSLVSVIGVPLMADSGEIKLIGLRSTGKFATRKINNCVEQSIEAAYYRVSNRVDIESKMERRHPLALLAKELILVVERELTIFQPEFRHWSPTAVIVSATKLNKLYGAQLRPYLKELSFLSEDVRSVLSAAHKLDTALTNLYISASGGDKSLQDLDHYQIEKIAGPIMLDWVISQHDRILQWIERVFDLEEWEPLSVQQRQAASVVEVFRIIEETVEQFFGWNLPMDLTHLQALLSVIFHSLDAYLQKLSNQLVEKKYLFPSVPPLTRYSEAVMPLIRKKLEYALSDDTMNEKITQLTIPKLCIRLNTLQYMRNQIATLEDGLRISWASVRCSEIQRKDREDLAESLNEDCLTYDERIDELFTTTFSSIKDTSTNASAKICDLIGARMVFWDLRDTLILNLYRDNVQDARLDKFLPKLDTALNHVCGLLDSSLRDHVVLNICRAALEGYIRVLLDGGPARVFSQGDIALMEDDLNTLKEFFIAGGEGLPRSLVDQEAKVAEHILHLYSFQTDGLIQMLLNASERISSGLDSRTRGSIPEDAQILMRILCHKKDKEASKFLKTQYQLPMSSEYDDLPSSSSSRELSTPVFSDLLKRSASVNWSGKGQKSLTSFRKKIQEATSEIRQVAW